MMAVWANPIWFQAFWGVAILIGIWIIHELWRKRSLANLGNYDLRKTTYRSVSAWRRYAREVLALSALTFAIIALANPQEEQGEMEIERQGLDMVFAIDLSRSMLAEDVSPSRLELAKQLVRNITQQNTGDRVGIMSFSGDAYVQMPISSDVMAAEFTLRNLDPKYIPTTGSDISSVFKVGMRMFDADSPQDKVLVIISDGEDHEGNWKPLVESITDSGIFVYTIGIGTESGAPIPGRKSGEYHKDQNGEVVISRREKSTLKSIAQLGNGKFYDGNRMNVAEDLKLDIKELQRAQFGMTKMADMEDKFQLPLGLALLCLVVRTLLSERSTNQLNKWLKNA